MRRPAASASAWRPAAAPGGGINEVPEAGFENIWGGTTHNTYGMCAMRHMHDYGTTSEQLAWIKVAASHHAQWNEHAMLREVVTVEEVLDSPMIADPLHRLDCCVISDGGGAVIMAAPEVAKSLKRPLVKVIGHGEAPKGPRGGQRPRPHLSPARSGPVRRPGKRRASSPPTSSTPRSTTASPSRC